ncbi:MAG: hypothetical protein Q8922_06345 [Bacteroidota bacterium]|nr:hypothetical protein [Bacteroidota bacterium]MDP4233778.1 hypothetical protein [Bacteroidota bacterium]MDP4287539.1 hypothetical protein [Bacteroidota bacterium]
MVSKTFAGPIFPTRGFLLQPKWYQKTDTTSMFDHGGYWASLQRGLGSDSDRWGWDISMGAAWEFARWSGNKSLFGFAGTELTANTHNDISFKPRGVDWEEGLAYAVKESDRFGWQLGTIYRCRHDLDNIDPRGYTGIGGQRTLIYCSLSGKTIFTAERILGLHIPTTSWLHADAYLIREDYRIPDSDAAYPPEYNHLAWSFGEAFSSKLAAWERSSVYLSMNINSSAFSNNTGFLDRFASVQKITVDSRAELGYAFEGRMGRIQFYGGYESWEDDGQVPIPRNASYATLGIRVTGSDMVTY